VDPRPLRCSFCSKTQAEVRKLIVGPLVYVCDGCVAQISMSMTAAAANVECSFCGNSGLRTFEGQGGAICEECIGLCKEIISADVGE